MHELDSQAIETSAGKYRVTWYYDEHAGQPEDQSFALFVDGWARSAYDSRIDIDTTEGTLPPLVENAILTSGKNREDSWDYELYSGAAIVRYMRLKGFVGVTLVDSDYRPAEPSVNRRQRVQGIAWERSEIGGQYDEEQARKNVNIDLEQWRAWAEGDTFGYVVTDPSGKDVEDGAMWGYYGFNLERDYTLSEAKSAAEYDASERIEQANRVGAGIVGLV